MSDLRVNNITNSGGGTGPVIAGVSTVASTGFMIMPVGNTEVRGAGSGRGVSAGGYANPSLTSAIEYITIATTGNGLDFGDLSQAKNNLGASASSTRGVFAGGEAPSPTSYTTQIDYMTISSSGGVSDFGDLTQARMPFMANSNDTISIIYGGYTGVNVNTIDFVTIATTGNASDFGSEFYMKRSCAATGNTTRAVIFGGYGYTGTFSDQPGPPYQAQSPIGPSSKVEFHNYASKGAGIPFGELSFKVYGAAGVSNNTRGVFAGGYDYRSPVLDNKNNMEYITFATEGNGTDFGDLTIARRSHGGMSNSIRGVFAGGYTPTILNTMDYITIASTGNATDFGDLLNIMRSHSCCSDVHGGLG